MAISPLDCMGCGVCIGACPVNALSMVAQEGELPQQDVFDYCMDKVSEKKDMQDNTVKGSQFKQPMLEFSGSCAGCAETSYARLVTQLFGDHMYTRLTGKVKRPDYRHKPEQTVRSSVRT